MDLVFAPSQVETWPIDRLALRPRLCRGRHRAPFRGSGALDHAQRMPLARLAARLGGWARVQAAPKVGEGDCIIRYVQSVSRDADFEYAMIDGSIVDVHRHGQGANAGLKARPSGALAPA